MTHAALERKIENLRKREETIIAHIEKLKAELRETRRNLHKREATKEYLDMTERKRPPREKSLDEIFDEIAKKYG